MAESDPTNKNYLQVQVAWFLGDYWNFNEKKE
jgi:hypothetical protein